MTQARGDRLSGKPMKALIGKITTEINPNPKKEFHY